MIAEEATDASLILSILIHSYPSSSHNKPEKGLQNDVN